MVTRPYINNILTHRKGSYDNNDNFDNDNITNYANTSDDKDGNDKTSTFRLC